MMSMTGDAIEAAVWYPTLRLHRLHPCHPLRRPFKQVINRLLSQAQEHKPRRKASVGVLLARA